MTETFQKISHATKWIPVKDISVIWVEAQRPLNDKNAKTISEEFDPDYFGVITVTKADANGHYHCVDGNTRVAAVKMLWGEKEQVPCNVLDADTPQRAAKIFAEMNGQRSKPSPVDLHHVSVTAGKELNVATDAVIKKHGYRVDHYKAEGVLSAIQACLWVVKRYESATLSEAFGVIQSVWARDKSSTDGLVIKIISQFLASHPKANRGRLVKKLRHKCPHPEVLIHDTKTKRDLDRLNTMDAGCEYLRLLYNSGARGEKLKGNEDIGL